LRCARTFTHQPGGPVLKPHLTLELDRGTHAPIDQSFRRHASHETRLSRHHTLSHRHRTRRALMQSEGSGLLWLRSLSLRPAHVEAVPPVLGSVGPEHRGRDTCSRLVRTALPWLVCRLSVLRWPIELDGRISFVGNVSRLEVIP